MCLVYEDECLRYLSEAQAYINMFHDIDAYDAIFEAKEADVEAKIIKNKKSNDGAFASLKKAAESLMNLIKNAMKTIIGGIEKLFASKSEKEAFEQFKKAAENNPSLKNKKIRFYDFKHNTEEWQEIERKAEIIDKKLEAGEDVDIGGIISDIKRYTEGIGKTAVGTVGAQAAINACYGSKEFARSLASAMNRDGLIMAEISDTLGEKEAKKFKKEVNSLAKDNKIAKLFGKRINLKRALNKSRVQQCQTLEESIKYTFKQIGSDITTANTAMNNIRNNNDLYASGGVKNFFRRQGNKIKAVTSGAPLIGDDAVRRGIRTLNDNPDAKEGIQRMQNIYGGASKRSTQRKRDMMDARRERDYDIADYNRRTGRGDYSAQSLGSFIGAGDKVKNVINNGNHPKLKKITPLQNLADRFSNDRTRINSDAEQYRRSHLDDDIF